MKPILIHKGDDTIFADYRKFLTFNLETNLDLTGWKAKFILGWITKEISDISSKQFEIILSSEDTKTLRLGSQCGQIILTDSKGNIKTITNSILFEVVTTVVETEYQEVDLTIPESAGIDLKMKIGTGFVTSVNGMTGVVELDIPSIEGLATEEQLQQGLDTKQDKGNYALKSEIPTVPTDISAFNNDVGYLTEHQDISNLATKEELSNKQDKLIAGSGIDITNNIISNTQTSAEWGNIQGTLSNQTDLQSVLDNKQDVITDLDTIREGASKGATALQSYTETDPVYTADKPNIALKSELPTTTSQLTNDSGFVTQDSLLEKSTETWTFTLEDGTEVTKTMVLGA